ncbi:DUF5959 family protein [Streptomyces sp. NPDC056600]|uniref:DUF5959 family protein n=1 Tax=Streptomyces sp. NPDC056600 TaxID=3345874 RepID=UPI0036A14D52
MTADGRTPATLALLRFQDRAQSVAVEVDHLAPLGSGDGRYYEARIVVRSGFVNGQVGLTVSLEDLDEWERCLDALEAPEAEAGAGDVTDEVAWGVEWPAGDRSAWLEVVPEDPLEVTVHDMPSTQISVRVPIDDPDQLPENRLRLERLRKALTQPV